MNFTQTQKYKDHLKKKKEAKKQLNRINYNRNRANVLREEQRNLKNPNEYAFKKMLIELDVRHEWQKPFFCHERYCCVDFYLYEKNIVVEIDGNCHVGKEIDDAKRSLYLKKVHGVKEILRITNKQIATQKNQVLDILHSILCL